MLEPLCGDSTCRGYGCTQEALDEYNLARHNDARAMFGRPPLTMDEWKSAPPLSRKDTD
jgi:hypothetical protein